MVSAGALDHSFEEGNGTLRLRVELPMVQSMEEVQLEVSELEVRLLTDDWHTMVLPKELAKDIAGEAVAKFSRKRQQLILSWPLSVNEVKSVSSSSNQGYQSEAKSQNDDSPLPEEAKEAKMAETLRTTEVATLEVETVPVEPTELSGSTQVPNEQETTPLPKDTSTEAFGSIWNKNSWHWEEKNCMDLATTEVRKSLEEDPAWKHVAELSGVSFRIKDLQLKGDASFALRKKKRLLCYELSASFKWEGRDEFGHALGVKGTAQVDGITPEDEEEPQVKIEVSTSSSGGAEAKAAGQWMKGHGAKRIIELLRGSELAARITAAEVAQAKPPDEEIARRVLEEKKATEAASAAAKQHRISEEARQREVQLRAQMRPTSEAVSGSVWNVNAWHWEEKPMTDFSIKWLSRELSGLSVQILSGLADLEFRNVQVTGDASVSVRKGKPIILYLLRIECQWEASATSQGLGEAKGNLILPEFSSEDGPKSSLIQVETNSDASRGRLGSAVRKEGISKVRNVLLRFEEALRGQLPRNNVT